MPPHYRVKQLYPEYTTYEEISFYDLTELSVRVGVSHWTELRGSRPYPAREELDVHKLGRALANISLISVVEDGADYLFRITGDEVRRAYSVQMHGRLLSELDAQMPQTVCRWRPMFENVVKNGKPIATRIRVGTNVPELNFSRAESVCLPFGSTGRVDHLVTFASHVLESVEAG